MTKSHDKKQGKKNKSDSRTYKLVELVGTSKNGYEDAIGNAITDAARSLEGLDWFQVTELRGAISGGKIESYQAVLKVGFRVLR